MKERMTARKVKHMKGGATAGRPYSETRSVYELALAGDYRPKRLHTWLLYGAAFAVAVRMWVLRAAFSQSASGEREAAGEVVGEAAEGVPKSGEKDFQDRAFRIVWGGFDDDPFEILATCEEVNPVGLTFLPGPRCVVPVSVERALQALAAYLEEPPEFVWFGPSEALDPWLDRSRGVVGPSEVEGGIRKPTLLTDLDAGREAVLRLLMTDPRPEVRRECPFHAMFDEELSAFVTARLRNDPDESVRREAERYAKE